MDSGLAQERALGDKRFAFARGMTNKHNSTSSRHELPELCQFIRPLKTKGAGNAGRSARPQPRV
jgi:hypothetical protein